MAQQQKAPAPQPAPKVEQKAPAKAARKSTAKKAAPKKSTAKKRTPSECVGLSETACHANTKCAWTKEITTKKGSKRKAHCGLKPTPPKAKKK